MTDGDQAPPDTGSLEGDISAEYGKAYQYSVQGLRGKVESDVAGPQTITPIDKFPPAVPSIRLHYVLRICWSETMKARPVSKLRSAVCSCGLRTSESSPGVAANLTRRLDHEHCRPGM